MITINEQQFESITDQFILLAGNGYGVYSMQRLLQNFDVDNVPKDVINRVRLNDPSTEGYWDDVNYIYDNAYIWLEGTNGRRYRIENNDGDIWAIPDWIDYPDDFWEWWQV